MVGYGVSREQIARAKEVGIEEYLLRNEPNNVRRVGNALYLKDHTSFEASNGLWNWHSQNIGGKNVIDYLIKVRGYGFVDAVRCLAGDDHSISLSVPQKARPPNSPVRSKNVEHQPLKLPTRNVNNDRVIAYLESRGISKPLIDECISTLKARHIDEMHFDLIGRHTETYHICQFAEIMERNGNKVEAIPGQKPTLDILFAKYGEKLTDTTIPMTEAALQKLVGGKYDMETLHYPSRTEQVKDKKVEIKGKAFGVVLRGKDGIAVCGLTDGVLTSLHPYNAQTQKRELSTERPKKPSLLANLEAKKAIVAENKANAEPTVAKSRAGLEV
jgi:hypothetical protein